MSEDSNKNHIKIDTKTKLDLLFWFASKIDISVTPTAVGRASTLIWGINFFSNRVYLSDIWLATKNA